MMNSIEIQTAKLYFGDVTLNVSDQKVKLKDHPSLLTRIIKTKSLTVSVPSIQISSTFTYNCIEKFNVLFLVFKLIDSVTCTAINSGILDNFQTSDNLGTKICNSDCYLPLIKKQQQMRHFKSLSYVQFQKKRH